MANGSHGNMPAIYTLLLGARPPIGQYPSRALFLVSFRLRGNKHDKLRNNTMGSIFITSQSLEMQFKLLKINYIKVPDLRNRKKLKTYVRVFFQKCDITGLVTSHDHSRTFYHQSLGLFLLCMVPIA